MGSLGYGDWGLQAGEGPGDGQGHEGVGHQGSGPPPGPPAAQPPGPWPRPRDAPGPVRWLPPGEGREGAGRAGAAGAHGHRVTRVCSLGLAARMAGLV